MKSQLAETIPANIAIKFRDGKIIHTETGSYTVLPPATLITVEKVYERIGVVKVEQVDPKFTDGVPIFKLNEAPMKARCHRQARQWSPESTPLNDPPRETFGKGMTVPQSKASATMEAVERYCGQDFPHNTIIKASYEKVAEFAIPPSAFKLPSLPPKCEYCGDKDWGCFPQLDKVCQEWSWGYSLINKKPVLVPSALVFYPYISKDDVSFIFNDTGGLSAGNTIEEAVLQGIAEVIERDALYYAFNMENLQTMPLVNFKNTKNRFIQKFITDVLPPEGIFAFLIENKELGLNIASFGAFICYKIGEERWYFGGSGTNLNPEIALLRALTELEQQKIRQKIFREFDRATLIKHQEPKNGNTLNLKELPNQSTGNIRTDIELYLDRLSKNGTDVIVVDLTHPDIGIPVVRILIPQLIYYSGSEIKESLLRNAMKTFGGQ